MHIVPKGISPCKDCSKRVMHCHSTCVEYSEYKGILQTISDNRVKYIKEKDCFVESVSRGTKKKYGVCNR